MKDKKMVYVFYGKPAKGKSILGRHLKKEEVTVFDDVSETNLEEKLTAAIFNNNDSVVIVNSKVTLDKLSELLKKITVEYVKLRWIIDFNVTLCNFEGINL